MHILLIDHALEIHLLGSWLTTTAPQPAVLHCPPPPARERIPADSHKKGARPGARERAARPVRMLTEVRTVQRMLLPPSDVRGSST